ncbi:RHS repeat-associated core domain-containing protein [Motiliproteus sp. MSK22-1]|uniref:RHS repeat-associated core domain-containing protein n=1 Tax=Motiliproteus sp. MSK22-1 TaxID=1897630 RepID=UPI000977B481|nr:RHS repeat-associated core domain-containing protein [Motiliproteus sp. MSK22-1]
MRDYDPETKLYYNYMRDYDSSIGRYVQSDPIGLDGGENTYGYVLGNPLNYTDKYGRAADMGSCTYEQWRPLRDAVQTACKTDLSFGKPLRKCEYHNSCEILFEKESRWQACAVARGVLSHTCFFDRIEDPSDGHADETISAIRLKEDCAAIIDSKPECKTCPAFK